MVTVHAVRERFDRFHAWRSNTGFLPMLALALGWAALMGLLAQVRIVLPFTPVPFTMQVFGTLLAAAVLGLRWGAASQGLYLGLGAAGLPVFQGAKAGLAHLAGATGGYLLAMPVAAALVAVVAARAPGYGRLVLAMLAGVAVIYAGGMAGLVVVLNLDLPRAFMLGVAPFVALDVGKALLAAGLARGVGARA
ncbi:MAG TPA: biotin transporter BioY [Candidatus Thermoplasmatota archaeon]|nr:biotin transporter BioY [Candidatus Thermoplasmatota archaeon]